MKEKKALLWIHFVFLQLTLKISQPIQDTPITSFHNIPEILEINANENCNLPNVDNCNHNSSLNSLNIKL